MATKLYFVIKTAPSLMEYDCTHNIQSIILGD